MLCEKDDEITLKSNDIVSMEIFPALAKFCNVPVKNPCGKKNPDIQKTWESKSDFSENRTMGRSQ